MTGSREAMLQRQNLRGTIGPLKPVGRNYSTDIVDMGNAGQAGAFGSGHAHERNIQQRLVAYPDLGHLPMEEAPSNGCQRAFERIGGQLRAGQAALHIETRAIAPIGTVSPISSPMPVAASTKRWRGSSNGSNDRINVPQCIGTMRLAKFTTHIYTAFWVLISASHKIAGIGTNTHQTKVAAAMIIGHVLTNLFKQAGMRLRIAGVEYRMAAGRKAI